VAQLGALGGIEQAQVLNHLRLSPLDVALLIDFGNTRLEIQRLSSAGALENTASV
jgi:hypothetical protein